MMYDDSLTTTRADLLRMAFLSEGAILVGAFVAGWFLNHLPTQDLKLTLEGTRLGILATIPLVFLLLLVYRSRSKALVQFRELVQKLLGKPLANCSVFDLCLIAASAGVAEEFLFRGVLQPWLNRWSWLLGLLLGNVLFGLCHAINVTYFLYSALIGIYLSCTVSWGTESNLLVPVICHALYDFIAFLVIRRLQRKMEMQNQPNDRNSTTPIFSPDLPIDPNRQ